MLAQDASPPPAKRLRSQERPEAEVLGVQGVEEQVGGCSDAATSNDVGGAAGAGPASATPAGAEPADACHPTAEEEDACRAAAESESLSEAQAFDRVRRNRVACIGHLVRLAQRIERVWDVEGGVLRCALLDTFRDALLSLRDHKDKQCEILAGLGDKMRNLDMDLRHFLTMALPIEREHTRGLRDDEFLITRAGDLAPQMPDESTSAGPTPKVAAAGEEQAIRHSIPLVFVLDNMRSAFNVGAVFRTADCLGVERMYLCGYTATPAEAKGQTSRAAMGAHEHVPWEHRPRTVPLLEELRAAGRHVVALETVADAKFVHEYPFPRTGVVVLLGNERYGLEADALAACAAVVRIPCRGVKNSLNVGVAAAVCGYEIARQWGWDGAEQGS